MKFRRKKKIKGIGHVARVLTITSIIVINVLTIILILSWSNYVNRYKTTESSAVVTIVKLAMNKDGDIGKTCSTIIDYIDSRENRTIAIYDHNFKLHNKYSNRANDDEDFNINDHPDLIHHITTTNSGQKDMKIGNHTEDIYWSWVTHNGQKKLLVVYGIQLGNNNEFSFVFDIAYLIIFFILILILSLYINYRNEYLTSMVKLYHASSCYK